MTDEGVMPEATQARCQATETGAGRLQADTRSTRAPRPIPRLMSRIARVRFLERDLLDLGLDAHLGRQRQELAHVGCA